MIFTFYTVSNELLCALILIVNNILKIELH